MKKILQTALFIFALNLIAAFSQAQNASAAEINVQFEEDNSLPIAYLNIVLDAGSAYDPPGKNGLAWVASHMLLRGTRKHGKLAFFEGINRLGGSLDVEVLNEGIVIRGAVLSKNVSRFMTLLEEALLQPKFEAQELMKLKSEGISELLEQKGNDRALVQYHFYHFFYGNHPYGNTPMGTQGGIKNISLKDVLDFYAKNFGEHTLHLFGTGALKGKDVGQWFGSVEERLGALHPDAHLLTPLQRPSIANGRRFLLIDKPTTQTQVLLGGLGARPETPGFYALLLANHSFGGPSFQARLMREIRVKRGWTYGIYNTFKFGRQPRHYAMYMFPKTDDTASAIGLSIQLLEDFAANGITPDEFKFAQDSLVNNAPFNFDTSKKRLENATIEYLAGLPKDYFKNFASSIKQVRFEDIAPALKNFFDPANLTLTVVGDKNKLKNDLIKLPGFGTVVEKNYRED